MLKRRGVIFTRVTDAGAFVLFNEVLILFPMKTPFFDDGIVMKMSGMGDGVGGKPLPLPLPSLVVLEPVEDILSLDFTIAPKLCTDGMNLISSGGSQPVDVVELLEQLYLFDCGSPPCTALPTQAAACVCFFTLIQSVHHIL